MVSRKSLICFAVQSHHEVPIDTRRGVDADSLARHARHDERNGPPVRRRPAGVGCAVLQDDITPP